MTDNSTLLQEDVEVISENQLNRKLVVHNDDVNTFEWVIKALMEICKHDEVQAEQSSYIIHHKGKYAVKIGSYNVLKPMKEAILDRGINSTID
jgi:ATP-dependent Clp protease adaptor protein ClpS